MIKYSIFPFVMLVLASITITGQTVTDIDGNIYNTLTIGTQTWMQENLKTTHFNNGIHIATTTLPVFNDTNALYQWAYNDDTSNVNTYGRLYTWLVASGNNNVCPAGWKVPDNSDWDILSNFLGGEFIAGGKMKEIGTTHWLVSDSTVTNSSGFTALGSGRRGNPSGWSKLGASSFFWSSTPFGSRGYPRGFGYRLQSTNNSLVQSIAVGQNGSSIRCILDQISSIDNFPVPNDIQLFPNPAKDRIYIRCKESGNYRLFIYDMIGNKLHEQNNANRLSEVDISFLTDGAYFIRLISEHQIYSYKFIKQ